MSPNFKAKEQILLSGEYGILHERHNMSRSGLSRGDNESHYVNEVTYVTVNFDNHRFFRLALHICL